MILNSKKLRKFRTNPKLFFKDAIEKKVFQLSNVYNKYLPKKHKGFTQYTIISAVYNVEKYLDDYFNSIINQRLDFKKNIFMILVDDGSTDDSANIIKKYQKKYPKNIIYLYKENGGQASARNLGLKYIQENNYKTPWVTFTDPDDFLDRNYFYEVDKFLSTHQDDDICMIGCNVIFYHEKQRIYKDNHPLNFKFKKGMQIRENYNLNNFIQLSAASCFMNITLLNNLIYDEKLKPNFEDAKFANEYLLENIDLKSAFLPKAKYFYRKREEGNSTLDNSNKNSDLYLLVSQRGCLKLLQKNKFYDIFIQNVCLYHFIWQIKFLVNSPEKLSFMSENEKQRYLELLDQNFSYIDKNTILDFYKIPGFNFFYQVGILNCFKNEKPPFQITYIEDYDPYKEQILITYYTGDDKDIESIIVDGEEVYADYEKIVKYDFLDRVFCYQKRLWIHIPKNAKDKLENFIDGEQSKISFNGKHHQNVNIQDIRKEFQKRLPKSNIWLLMDRDYEADDNAEHLYRYIMQNHPEQEIVFVLRKESSDWKRLEKERFNLIEFGSFEFERIIKKASKVISSHCDEYLMRYITPRQQFIFLQHGIIKDDLSKWFNSKKIDLLITSTKTEYDSIVNDYNRYKFGKKEVILTGLARHDALLKNNKNDTKQIFIMPTWRKNIVGNVAKSDIKDLKEYFKRSEYFQKWNSLLNNNNLKKLCELYSYAIVFNPHPYIMSYLKEFNISSYIKIANKNESLQKLFCDSSLMITDYSSVAFEMAYLEKPVLYYQFDKEEFFTSHTYQKGYFDYKKNGFGSVVENEENLLKELEILLKNNCKPFGVYKDNIDLTFVFKDCRCCERIYKKLNSI
ncbi:CDP-glycerol glycerophosphotransferase family protein [Campylobacter lari]|uniref:CDP-glycerol glycerophosphotransferase family protein n=6 Tax=Campylobacter lari TaxID=201 RepID=UPI001415DBB4|nr:CDP-glycerol glycerophosphotransferase family protein [Campylobacter lari]HEF1511143.1 CDP-glycerol glycerophosphotransferase family protein [Campylobacter jejuni]EDP6899735.1 glycosyltransferase [Campylobacter lari]EKO4764468.1 CDP-glycerol glycerophosphotransferase family protein [Campylobacter lari]MBX1370054.1 CDP-glycerol glycerophosphotransferase family protein [Campylobacter lari]MCV3339277.1 CDP-glycerol:glycerophosphate glycerophosphotransferase [Campylobacter lari]